MKKLILMACFWGSLIPNFLQASDEKKDIPVLIPFNQVLFNQYCVSKAQKYERASEDLTFMWGFGLIAVVAGIYTISQIGDKISTEWTGWQKSNGIGSSLWNGGKIFAVTAWSANSVFGWVGSIKNFCTNTEKLGSNTYEDQYKEWHRVLCTTVDEQQRKWHEIIYELFGKPTVKGIVQEDKPYMLHFNKNGLGMIVFDPYDLESVKVLLGLHATKKDTCLCEEIIIV